MGYIGENSRIHVTKCKSKELPSILLFFIKAMQLAPSADNSQPWHCFWDGKDLFLVYDSNRVGGAVFGPESQATLLAIGGVIEHVEQAADAVNVPLIIDFSPKSYRSEHCYCKITFDAKEGLLPNVDIAGFPFSKRHTNRLGFKSMPIPGDVIEEVCGESEQQSRTLLFDEQESIKQIADLIFDASKIRFQTKELHEWLSNSLRFGDASETVGDGLDVNTIDLPPGGGVFMRFIRPWKTMSFLNKLGAYWAMAKVDSTPIVQAPAVISISSPSTYQGAIGAGRLISRIWIYLNEKGIAVHPYYVISDQLQRHEEGLVPDRLVSDTALLMDKVKAFFGLSEGETLQILLRIGYPEKEPVRSKRLPLKVIFTDISES